MGVTANIPSSCGNLNLGPQLPPEPVKPRHHHGRHPSSPFTILISGRAHHGQSSPAKVKISLPSHAYQHLHGALFTVSTEAWMSNLVDDAQRHLHSFVPHGPRFNRVVQSCRSKDNVYYYCIYHLRIYPTRFQPLTFGKLSKK